jgi:hypothetical protein
MYKKFLTFLFVLFLFFPITCFARTIKYDQEKIQFEINNSAWMEKALSEERTFVNRKWVDCSGGVLMTGSLDLYSILEMDNSKNVSREDYNYINLLQTNNDALMILNLIESSYEVNNWEYTYNKMKFIYFNGQMNQDGLNINYDIYLTINNGYLFMFQYMKSSNPSNNVICINPLSEVVSSAESTINVRSLSEKNDTYQFLSILIGVAITFVCYEIYPFIRVVLMKKEYDEKQVKKMAKWNSVIVCLVTYIIILIIFEEARRSPSTAMGIPAAYLYYLINKKVWVSKNNKEEKKKKEKKEKKEKEKKKQEKKEIVEEIINEEYTSVCSNCGTMVKDTDIVCPNCGESFDDEEEVEEEIETDMDQKYSDLKKLKQLLDEKIITKAEFEKEKKKILK